MLARAGDTWVWIDMEGSAYTERTLTIYRRLRRRWRNVACVLQAYLHRTEADVRGLVPGVRMRLQGGLSRALERRVPAKGGRGPELRPASRDAALEGGAGRRGLAASPRTTSA